MKCTKSQNSPRATFCERLVIESRYAEFVDRDPSKHFALLEELVRKYPQEKRFHNDLGIDYQDAGRLLEAEKQFDNAIEVG